MQHVSPKVLLIDSNKSNIGALSEIIVTAGYQLSCLKNSQQAIEELVNNRNSYCAVIVGLSPEYMEKQTLIEKLGQNKELKSLAIIVQKHEGEYNDIEKDLRLGARYHLDTPLRRSFTISIIECAIRDNEQYLQLHASYSSESQIISILQSGSFQFQSMEEAYALAKFIANTCPNPRMTIVGLSEIFLNAIEHGNLSIGYEEKSQLQNNELWVKEVNRRIHLPEHRHKYVYVKYERHKHDIRVWVKDEGKGFDYGKFEKFDKQRILDSHGRGIMMARSLAFEKLEFFGSGSEVMCVISLDLNTED